MSGFTIHGLRGGPVVLRLAIAILLAGCDPRPTVMTPQYRFVDPRLRASGDGRQQPLSELDPVTRIREAARTVYAPIAAIRADTRYVLKSHSSRVLVPGQTIDLRGGRRLTYSARVGYAFPKAERLALFTAVRLEQGWKTFPGVTREIEESDQGRIVRIHLYLPESTEQSTAKLYVKAYPVPTEPRTSYRTPEIVIPSGAVLEFSMGILEVAWEHGPVEFSVSICESSRCSQLFTETLDPAQAPDQDWQDRRVPLGAHSGTRRALMFSTNHRKNSSVAFSLPLWGNPTLYAPSPAILPGPNLIVLSIDTLRADHLSTYGYGRDTSPFLETSMAAKGTVFDNFIAAATSTGPSHMSLFTSLPPSAHGVTASFAAKLPASVLTLAQLLRGDGYETAAITEDGPLAAYRGFARGFSVYKENTSANFMAPEGHVHKTLAWGKQWLERNKHKRVFLFLHTFQVHTPYDPPPAYAPLFEEGAERKPAKERDSRGAHMVAQYDREIRYVDDELRAFFSDLVKQGISDNTVFVILSDHGEEFFEHGFHGHGAGLYREVLHVPLIFFGRGIPSGQRLAGSVRHIDFMPTLLELAGARIPAQARGNSLARLVWGSEHERDRKSVPIFSSSWVVNELKARGAKPPSFSVQLGSRKLVRYLTDDGYRYEYYELAEDPGEMANLYRETSKDVRELKHLLDKFVAANRSLQAQLRSARPHEISALGSEVDLDPRRAEKLRALGYLE